MSLCCHCKYFTTLLARPSSSYTLAQPHTHMPKTEQSLKQHRQNSPACLKLSVGPHWIQGWVGGLNSTSFYSAFLLFWFGFSFSYTIDDHSQGLTLLRQALCQSPEQAQSAFPDLSLLPLLTVNFNCSLCLHEQSSNSFALWKIFHPIPV